MTSKKNNSVPQQNTPDKDLQDRVQLFDKEFQAIQQKYMLRVVAQVILPGGAMLTVPIQVFPITPQTPANPAEKASIPE